jgi:thioredoxin 1
MSATTTEVTDATFDEVVRGSSEPVLVDFWAEWCGPCKVVAPVLEELAATYEGRLRVAKVNVDENLEVTRRYEVMSIPTLMLFKDGEPVLRLVGARSRSQLVEELSPWL